MLQIRKEKSFKTVWQDRTGQDRTGQDRTGQTRQWTGTSVITMCPNPEIWLLIACSLGTSFYSSLSVRERERERETEREKDTHTHTHTLSDDVIACNLRETA